MPRPINWERYRELVDLFSNQANRETIIWRREQGFIDRFGEGGRNNFNDISLLVLIQYNIVRSWPLSKNTDVGALDPQNMFVFINKEYIRELGYLNSDGYFDFNPDRDVFVHRGITYRTQGDQEASSADTDALHICLTLRRDTKDS